MRVLDIRLTIVEWWAELWDWILGYIYFCIYKHTGNVSIQMYILLSLVSLEDTTLQLCCSRSSEKVWKTNCFVSLVNRKSTRIFLVIGHHEVKRNQSHKNCVCLYDSAFSGWKCNNHCSGVCKFRFPTKLAKWTPSFLS